MNSMRIYLLIIGLFLLNALSLAVEVQPKAEDWDNLLSKAKSAKQQCSYLLPRVQNRLEVEKSKASPRSDGLVLGAVWGGSPEIPFSIAVLETMVEQETTASKTLDDIIAGLTAMKAEDHSRDRYFALLHQISECRRQYEHDEALFYHGTPADQERQEVERLEAKLKALTATPPERIPAKPLPQGLQLGWQDFPRIDGSTTAQPLSALIVSRLLGLSAEWDVRWIHDYRNTEGTDERFLVPVCTEPPMLVNTNLNPEAVSPGLRITVNLSGTHPAYRNLILGASNFIIVATPPSAEEQALAKEKGVELDVPPIAYDAFIFLLNAKNPVNSLTINQIQDIYQDNVLRWTEVGGADEKVIATQREAGSGSQVTMEGVVMKGLKIAPAERMMIGFGMGGPYNELASLQNGIGYTFYYYHTVQSPSSPALSRGAATSPRKPSIKICAVNGIAPTPETIRNHTYPFTTEVYAVVRKDTAHDAPAVRLRDWLLTPEGQALVKESGYIPLREE